MRWSKLKQRIEEYFADSVRGRVELHQTRYRESHDQKGELWVTLDGEQVFSAASMTALNALQKLHTEFRRNGETLRDSYDLADQKLEADGTVEAGRLVVLLKDYLNQSIDQVMASPSPIIRGIAVLDRRFGVRRLERFEASDEHDFVVRMFKIRCDLEGLPRRVSRSGLGATP